MPVTTQAEPRTAAIPHFDLVGAFGHRAGALPSPTTP
jgi:hypothetical protein